MTATPTLVVLTTSGDASINGRAQTPTLVQISNPSDIHLGGSLASNLDGAGYSITNFDNGHTTADAALGTDASTAVLAVVLSGLTASKIYLAQLGVRVFQYLDSAHGTGGAIDIVIGVSIATDGASVATVTLSGTPVPDTSNLPAGLSGATATVAASAGGFTISATRKAGSASHARAKWFVNKFEDVT
jgi:hypothetical protein